MSTHHLKVRRSLRAAILFVLFASLAAQPRAVVPAHVSPSDKTFVDTVDNPYFPLLKGTTFTYAGTVDGRPAEDVMSVTSDVKVIQGVRVTVVHDVLSIGGIRTEDTFDWYAQDTAGNVWYFGEDTKELDPNGNVISTEGSWAAGKNGAQAGFIMLAHPQVGDTYQQEFAPGVAEDQATVLSVNKSVNVAYGSFNNVLLTRETTPLAPSDVGNKYYAPGVGLILEVAKKGGKERFELVSVTQ
jgi:hypothetical protein